MVFLAIMVSFVGGMLCGVIIGRPPAPQDKKNGAGP